jgi:hypothetical protein
VAVALIVRLKELGMQQPAWADMTATAGTCHFADAARWPVCPSAIAEQKFNFGAIQQGHIACPPSDRAQRRHT